MVMVPILATVLIMGGTGGTTPTQVEMDTLLNGVFAGQATPVTTPEQWFPFIGTLTWDQSVAEGQQDLDAAIKGTDGPITVVGQSQSAHIITLELRALNDDPDAPAPAL